MSARSGHAAPSASRIAEILRSHEPWPLQAAMPQPAPLMLRGADLGLGGGYGNYGNGGNAALALGFPAAGGGLGPATGAQAQVAQLAERTSLLVASVQKQMEVEREEVSRHVEQVAIRLDSRIATIESRLASCEDQSAVRERRECEAIATIPSRVLRETRALVTGSINEAQAQWRAQRVEFSEECRELARRLDELTEQSMQGIWTTPSSGRPWTTRLACCCVCPCCAADLGQPNQRHEHGARHIQEAENMVEDQACSVRQLQDEIQALQAQAKEPAPWFTGLETHVAKLEKRLEEQLLGVEVRLQQRRQEAAEHLQNFQEDLLSSMEEKLEKEIDRVLLAEKPQQENGAVAAVKDVARRLDDIDARVSALRVRLDGLDGRFVNVAERAEAACQQALETVRQTAAQNREEILSEADCQMRILRQRVEALGELCDELSMREVARNSQPSGQRVSSTPLPMPALPGGLSSLVERSSERGFHSGKDFDVDIGARMPSLPPY
eukprot:TRINITY_DN17381_c0_g1_i2.p1 TRINITY_DN17381_c0_g1~~TRINITY_DN17381_c0_g1_i2.p1  ORF type:complete len:497 (-),score=116.93 TRINITY_DN17381_c0_g1_i2:77-1567(-)